jgi:hypothetical protein
MLMGSVSTTSPHYQLKYTLLASDETNTDA